MEVLEVKGRTDNIRKYIKSCSKQGIYHIRGAHEGTTATLYVVKNSHQITRDLARDFNCKIQDFGEEPPSVEAPCGARMIASVKSAHERACNSCRTLAGLGVRRPRGVKDNKHQVKTKKGGRGQQNSKDGEVKTLVSVPGLTEFSVAGMLEEMKSRRDELFELSEEYEQAIKTIEAASERQEAYERLKVQVEEDRKALGYFITNESQQEKEEVPVGG